MAEEYVDLDAGLYCGVDRSPASRCFRTNRPSNLGAGQQCCYNEQGNLMVGPLNGGSLDRVHVEAGVPVLSHFFHDLVPYSDCCLLSANCGRYFAKRPSDDGSKYDPPRPAPATGDPHIVTLDSVEYTFNGFGEYHIVQVAEPEFKLQGRMLPLVDAQGNFSRATVFKAFAMKEKGSDIIQIQTGGRDEIEILLNGDIMELDEQFMMDFNGFIVYKCSNKWEYSVIFNSGIFVTIEKTNDNILQMMLLVPSRFRGNTSGLLGLWNGDKEQEFLLPNDTFLDTNSSQAEIHYGFGQQWAVYANDSLFTYDKGKSHASYFDVGYKPIFLDQENLIFSNATLGKLARDVCGDSKQCLFDIYVTGKVSIGRATKRAMESFTTVINEKETPGCIPIKEELDNGNVLRYDAKDGRMNFRFQCNSGFRLNGFSVISCFQGQWNGSKPSCRQMGPLVISPQSAIMLGGDNILIFGPYYKPSQHIVCEFPGGQLTNGSYISDTRASCTVPMLNVTGRLPIKVSLNGGTSFEFQGSFTIVNINRFRPLVTRLATETWIEEQPVNIAWDPVHLGPENQTVDIQLARYSMENDGRVFFHSMYTIMKDQLNIGEARFSVPRGEGQGASVGRGRFITLVAVKRTGVKHGYAPAEWIWSDLFVWINYDLAHERCLYWFLREPDPKIYTDDTSLLSCPQRLAQALVDRGRFMAEEYVDLDAGLYCGVDRSPASRCFRTSRPSNLGAGQQCCYNEQGNLMIGPLHGGSLDRVHVEAGVPVLSHFFHDLVPYSDCCLLFANCEKYFEKRPSDDGSKYDPPRPAVTFGDPHIVTLDGVQYTFNGYGEYHILQVVGPEFKLQGRMLPLVDEQGNVDNATVYKAFAMKEDASDILQVRIGDRDEVEILVNGNIMELDEKFMMDFNGFIVYKCSNTSKYSVIFNSGILVTIEQTNDNILQLMLLVPRRFKGNTIGLLGLWNGDKEQEFLLPNGSFVENTSSQAKIHYEFGEKWANTANDSLFITYDEGKRNASYLDVGYTPIFLDQEDLVFKNETLQKLARDVCGDSKQCLFDIYVTGKVSIGRASKQALESFAAVINITETPGCIPIKEKLDDGEVLRNDTKDGRMIFRFQCHPEFQLNGSTIISCLYGQWNGSKPSCQPRVCPPMVSVENGHVDGYGSRYWFTCSKGFSLIGPDNIHCGKDGQWNGTFPKCVQDISDSGMPSYVYAAVSGAASVVVVTIVVVACLLVTGRRKKKNHAKRKSRAKPKEVSAFKNPAYSSSIDINT